MLNIEPIASGSTGNAYYITDGDKQILIECGISRKEFKEWCFENHHNYRTIDACLVSHSHKDHSALVNYLSEIGVQMYLPKDTIEEIGAKWCQPVAPFPTKKDYHRIGESKLYAFPVEHDVTNYAYLLDNKGYRLLYATDTNYMPWQFNKLTHLMIECNHDINMIYQAIVDGELDEGQSKRILQTHMSIQTLIPYIKKMDKSRLKEVWLLHLSNRHSDEEKFRQAIQNLVECPVFIA